MLTSGSVNVYEVQFKFSADWDDLEKTVAFTDGIGEPILTRVNELNQCKIPWECIQTAGRELKVGVQGVKDATVILPTIWISLGKIKQGVTLGEMTQEPTPEIYNQILQSVQEALDKSQEVLDKMPEPMTAEQLRELLESIKIEDTSNNSENKNESEVKVNG